MNIILLTLSLVVLTYWLEKPVNENKRQVGRPRSPKKFGEGLLIDNKSVNWQPWMDI